MTEYVKILSGAMYAEMPDSKFRQYVQLTCSETSPGAGWYPVVKVLPKPAPGEGEELAYSYTVREDGKVYKEYFLVPKGWEPTRPRKWSRFTIKGALADAHLLPAAKAFLGAYELKPDYSALEAFTDVDYIEEFYGGMEKWNALLDGAAGALGKTREEIDAFLDALPTED